MGKLTILALRIVLAGLLAGSLFVQVWMVPLIANDMNVADPDVARVRTPFIVVIVLGILTIQVAMICVWRLLTMVRRGTVFSPAAFRYVDVMIGAAVAAALIAFTFGLILAPGEAVPPGIVLLIGGVGAMAAGIALVILVMRMLLAQAVARETEAQHLRAELDEVI
jgi:hypothetical protein